MKHGEPRIKNTVPRHAAPLSPEECASATGLSFRTIRVAIDSRALPSKDGKVKMVDLIAWRNSEER
jgi:hypothetical protein